MTLRRTFTSFRDFAGAFFLAGCFANVASASTVLTDVSVDVMAFYKGSDLEVFVSDAGSNNLFFEAFDVVDFNAFVAIDFDDLTESEIESSSSFDLDVVDIRTGNTVNGEALDFAFDYDTDSLQVLYKLNVNDFTSSKLGVAVLHFEIELDASLGFTDLDGQLVEFDLFGATPKAESVPLPSTLSLALAGLASFIWLSWRRRES